MVLQQLWPSSSYGPSRCLRYAVGDADKEPVSSRCMDMGRYKDNDFSELVIRPIYL